MNGIGETSDEILTILPLNIQLIYCYLAQTSYKLKHYQIAKDAAEAVCSCFVEKNDVKSVYLDSKISPIYSFKLKHKYCKLVSIPLLKQVGESFLILGRIFKKKKEEREPLSKEIT